ncbi:B-cell receptor CD22-like [Sardina pilchardus]|uniref:B-cell receptor CD22-like n=1 Tax=Sardina pilchardus TaxID=27697 RepID=UPI002E16494F
MTDLLCKEPKKEDWVVIEKQHICAVKGTSVVMLCSLTPPAGHTVTKVFWLINPKKGAEPPDLYDNQSYTGRVQYYWNKRNNKSICTLELTSLKLTDSAVYKVRIIAGTDKWQSDAFVKLTVIEFAVQFPNPVFEGKKVELNCTSTSDTCSLKGNVTWSKNGQRLSETQTTGPKLLLKTLRVEDEGDYSCALKGYEEHPSPPVKLNVMFLPKNTLVSVRPDVNITNGESVTLTCRSDANPPVENYTWFKVDESNPVRSGQQYSITNIKSEDGGQYYCEARNKYGAENSSSVSITVKGARRSVVYVIAGVSVCGAAGLICVLVWYRYRKTNTQASRKEQDQGDIQDSDTDPPRPGGSRAAGTPSVEAAGTQEDDVHYASVQLKYARTAHSSSVQPEGEHSVIYSSVETRD